MGFPVAEKPVFMLKGRGKSGTLEETTVRTAYESELAIRQDGSPIVRLMCSPSSLEELALGFLKNERVIGSTTDLAQFKLDELAMTCDFSLVSGQRIAQSSPCPTVTTGLGGKSLLRPSAVRSLGVADTSLRLVGDMEPERMARAMNEAVMTMSSHEIEYARTRGIHCSALFCANEMVCCYEDVGRHNTFDKLTGHCMLQNIDMTRMLLTTTGRISSEMVLKAAAMGVSAIASCSGPTSLALKLAEGYGIAIAGYSGKPGEAIVYGLGRGMLWNEEWNPECLSSAPHPEMEWSSYSGQFFQRISLSSAPNYREHNIRSASAPSVCCERDWLTLMCPAPLHSSPVLKPRRSQVFASGC